MIHFRNLRLGLAVLTTLGLTSTQAARAQQLYNFTFADGGDNISGTLFTSATVNTDGSYTAISGNIIIGTNSAGLLAGTYSLLAVNGFAGNNNEVFASASPVVDFNGLSFGTNPFDSSATSGPGNYAVNIASEVPFNAADTYPYFLLDSSGNSPTGSLTLTAADSPEPSSLFLIVPGALTLGGMVIRRRKAAVKGA